MNKRMAVWVRLATLIAVVGVCLSILGVAYAGLNAWTPLGATNQPTNGDIHALAISPTYATDKTLFAGGHFFGPGGIYRWTSVEPTWTKIITGLPPEALVNSLVISPAYATDHTVFAGTDYGAYKSTTGGDSWSEVDTGFPGYPDFPDGGGLNSFRINAVAVSPNYATDHTVFAGGALWGAAGMFKSTSSVETSWTDINEGLPPQAEVRSIAVSPAFATDHTVYLGTDWGVYKSTNGGDIWAEDDAGFPTGGSLASYAVKAIAISPNYATDHTVFAGGKFFGAAGIFKSTSAETNWTSTADGVPPDARVNALVISPAYATDLRVFAGTDLGVYKSASGGASWSQRNDGLPVPATPVFSLAVSPTFATDHTLFAGSSGGNGVFAFTTDEYVVTPIEGANRISTAIAASAQAFPEGSGTVVIATGFNWPDALGGASLAGALDAPILLTSTAALPAEVMTEIRRLNATSAYILGGTPAVSTGVEAALKAELGSSNVTRLAGDSRYSTARVIAARTVDVLEAAGGYDGTCFIATGTSFPDALGASPLAAAKGWPIYLVNPAVALDTATKSALASDGVHYPIILGSASAIPTRIETALNGIYGAPNVERLFGTNRYSTAVAVATYGVVNAGLGWDKLALATGTNFPDALAGGVLQGKDGSIMLLTPGTSLEISVRAVLIANKATIDEVRYLGSISAVSAAVRTAVSQILQ
jgi:putative cell wall-binding protein